MKLITRYKQEGSTEAWAVSINHEGPYKWESAEDSFIRMMQQGGRNLCPHLTVQLVKVVKGVEKLVVQLSTESYPYNATNEWYDTIKSSIPMPSN